MSETKRVGRFILVSIIVNPLFPHAIEVRLNRIQSTSSSRPWGLRVSMLEFPWGIRRVGK